MSEGDGVGATHYGDVLGSYHRLPAAIKRRVRALKKLQLETVKIDVAFYKELFDLEVKYDVEHQRVFEKRKAILTGAHEPTDDECDWPSDDEHPAADGDEVDKLCDDVTKKVAVLDEKEKNNEQTGIDVKGIPDFWLTAFKNSPLLEEAVQEHDEEILRHLVDVTCHLHSDERGFTLHFHFSPNEYFTDEVLSKRYYFNYEISTSEPLEYEGPEIVKAKGCTINWKPGKNVTVKIVKKVQKKKGGGGKRTITKSVQEDSFFNFFDPPAESLSDDLDEDTEMLLETDFKMGQFLRDSIIPRAVLFFTGEEIVDISDDEEDEEDSDEDGEDDSDDSDHHRAVRHHRGGGRTKRGGGGGGNVAGSGEQPECKQQ